MSVSLERLARNQALYREVNERIVDLLDEPKGTIEFICECSIETCRETITLTVDEYEQARAQPTTFVIVPGHETPAIEIVTESNPRYSIVDKMVGREAVTALATRRPQPAT
jgi:hypothetical protein